MKGAGARYRSPDGREHSRIFAKRGDAVRWLHQIETEKTLGTWRDPAQGRVTYRVWCERYLAEANKRATTLARDKTVNRRHLLPRLGDMPMASITAKDVRDAIRGMSRQLAPSTLRTNLGVLRAIMSAAVDAEVVAVNPFRNVRVPAAGRAEIRFLSAGELERLAQATPSQYRAAIYLAGAMGLRWSEVAGLRVGKVDFLRRSLEVSETLAEVDGRLIERSQVKSAASRRTLSIPPFLIDLLAEHLAARADRSPSDYLFQAPQGGPMRVANFRNRVWRPAVRAAGLDGLTFHGLRHSAAGLMIEVGAHVEVIKQRLGHSSIRVTSDVYGSVLPMVDDGVTLAIDRLLSTPAAFDAAWRGDAGPSDARIEDETPGQGQWR